MKEIIIDFSDMTPPEEPEDKQNPPPDYIPEGEYVCRVIDAVVKVTRYQSFYLSWELYPLGQHEDFRLYLITSLKPEHLWATADFIEAATGHRPQGVFKLSPSQIIGRQVRVDVKVNMLEPDKIRNSVRLAKKQA